MQKTSLFHISPQCFFSCFVRAHNLLETTRNIQNHSKIYYLTLNLKPLPHPLRGDQIDKYMKGEHITTNKEGVESSDSEIDNIMSPT